MFDHPFISEFINLVYQSIQEFTVVRDDDNRTVKLFQSIFQHIFRTHVQMVGRFVEDQQVHRFQQQTDHGQTGLFSTRQYLHFLVRRFSTEHESPQYVPYLQTDVPLCHVIHRIENGHILIQQLCLVLCKIADLHIMPQLKLSCKIGDLSHYAFNQRGLTFTVLADKSDFVSAANSESGMLENQMVAIALGHIFRNHRIGTGTGSRREFQAQHSRIHFVHLYAFNLFQLFDTGLHLHGLGRFIAETLDESFRIGQFLLLVFKGTKLLFAALFTQFHIFGVFYLIVINLPKLYLYRPESRIIDKRPVM